MEADVSTMADSEIFNDEETMPWLAKGKRVVYIRDFALSQEDESTETDGQQLHVPLFRPKKVKTDMVSLGGDYWQIRKIMKFVKAGDEGTTDASLGLLGEYDFKVPQNLYAVVDTNGLETLINILETGCVCCQLGSLKVLGEMSSNYHIQVMMITLGALPTLFELLESPVKDVQKLAAKNIFHLTAQKVARTISRKYNIIPLMVQLIDIPVEKLRQPLEGQPVGGREEYMMAMYSIKAVTELSRSRAIRKVLYKCGILQILHQLLKASEDEVSMAALKLTMHCSSLSIFQRSFAVHGTMQFILKNLQSTSIDRQKLAFRAIFKCANFGKLAADVRKFDGLPIISRFLKDDTTTKDYKLLKYCTASVWNLCSDKLNVQFMNKESIVPTLIKLLDSIHKMVLVNVTGVLSRMTTYKANRQTINKFNGISKITFLLSSVSEQQLLVNLSRIVRDCAQDLSCIDTLKEQDTIRLMWSLLDNKYPMVQANAARALVPLVRNIGDSGEQIRSFVGGVDILMSLLDSKSNEVVSGACVAIGTIAGDQENLGVITELGVVGKLRTLAESEDPRVQRSVAIAIANVSRNKANRFKFGELGCVEAIVRYLKSKDRNVAIAGTYALWRLSYDPINCITLHRSKVVPFLLNAMVSQSKALQTAAGGCLNNMRNLAHDAEALQKLDILPEKRKEKKRKVRQPKD